MITIPALLGCALRSNEFTALWSMPIDHVTCRLRGNCFGDWPGWSAVEIAKVDLVIPAFETGGGLERENRDQEHDVIMRFLKAAQHLRSSGWRAKKAIKEVAEAILPASIVSTYFGPRSR